MLRAMPFPDPFFEDIVGHWKLTGEILGKPIEQEVDARWILGGCYLQIEYHPSVITPIGIEPYEALSHIAYDSDRNEYALYLLDNFGGGYSPPGFGTLNGDRVAFLFEYKTGPFTTTFGRDAEGWEIELRSGNEPFGVKRLRRG